MHVFYTNYIVNYSALSLSMYYVSQFRHNCKCTIWNNQIENFESLLRERTCYEIRNLTIMLNSYKYKATNDQYRLYFKSNISAKSIVDSSISFYEFSFTPYTNIF